MSLQERCCLPILTSIIAALKYKVKQYDELNACWNSVYRTIFGFRKHESVRAFINGLGRLDLHHLVRVYRVKFYLRLINSERGLLRKLFWLHVALNCVKDEELYLVCLRFSKANILQKNL